MKMLPGSDRKSLAAAWNWRLRLVLKQTSAELPTAASAHTLDHQGDRSPVKSLLDLNRDILCHNLLYLLHVAALCTLFLCFLGTSRQSVAWQERGSRPDFHIYNSNLPSGAVLSPPIAE